MRLLLDKVCAGALYTIKIVYSYIIIYSYIIEPINVTGGEAKLEAHLSK